MLTMLVNKILTFNLFPSYTFTFSIDSFTLKHGFPASIIKSDCASSFTKNTDCFIIHSLHGTLEPLTDSIFISTFKFEASFK